MHALLNNDAGASSLAAGQLSAYRVSALQSSRAHATFAGHNSHECQVKPAKKVCLLQCVSCGPKSLPFLSLEPRARLIYLVKRRVCAVAMTCELNRFSKTDSNDRSGAGGRTSRSSCRPMKLLLASTLQLRCTCFLSMKPTRCGEESQVRCSPYTWRMTSSCKLLCHSAYRRNQCSGVSHMATWTIQVLAPVSLRVLSPSAFLIPAGRAVRRDSESRASRDTRPLLGRERAQCGLALASLFHGTW